MNSELPWRQNQLSHLARISKFDISRSLHEALNDELLSAWVVAEGYHCSTDQSNAVQSELAEANCNITVWFSTVSLLAEEVTGRGFEPAKTQFIDVGLVALYALGVLGFSIAVGIDYQANRACEASELISSACQTEGMKNRVPIGHADATAYSLSPPRAESRVILIFNEFGLNTMQALMRNNEEECTFAGVIALADDVTLLITLIDSLPRCMWLSSYDMNSFLAFPGGSPAITGTVLNRRIV